MFEAAEVGATLSKADYRRQVPALRADLLEAQQALRQASFPVIVLFAGVDTAGKGETVNLLNTWMDPRWIVTRGYTEPSEDERERPRLWRYWRDLPPAGRVAFFLSAWYSSPIRRRVAREISTAELDTQLDRIAAFERTLADDGAIILKFWMHLGRSAQKKRLRAFERDPLHRWRVTKEQWRHWRMYDRFVAAADQAIRRTSTEQAPWHIVEGADERYRSVAVASVLRDALRAGLARAPVERAAPTRPAAKKGRETGNPAARGPGRVARMPNVLSRLDMTLRADPEQAAPIIARQQARLGRLQRRAGATGVSTVAVFEGWDAAGKGGAIRRVTAALDARDCQVVPIGPPTDEERARHYLWRFWRHLSRAGRLTIFDRSWYGRVLVERVEALASPAEWARAYAEINHFEDQLVEHGVLLVKFWIHITPREQLRRFRERETVAHKRWKITDEDWRNRARWDDYEAAVSELVARTSTAIAPWTLVEGNDKAYARIKILTTLADRLAAGLKR